MDTFNFLTGLLFVIVFLTVLVGLYFIIKHVIGGSTNKNEATIVHRLVVFLLIVSVIIGFGDIVYSFYIASQVYGQFDEFQKGQINCSSPVYYSSFVSVVIVFLYTFIEFALAILLCLSVAVDYNARIFC